MGATIPPVSRSILPLSILIRTFNEADRVGAAIGSALALGSEIIVIDAGSTDATVTICEELGAKVFHHPWSGFGPQRRYGEELCSHDYIFSLDADEVLPPDTAAEITRILLGRDPPRLLALRKAMIFPHHERPPRFGFCHRQILIYDRRIARTAPDPNWDRLEIDIREKAHLIRQPLWHYSLRDWHHGVNKLNYVASLAADTQPPRSRVSLALRLIVEFPVTFLKFYVLRRYFLGGIDGFTMAIVGAFGRFMRIAMMLERSGHGHEK